MVATRVQNVLKPRIEYLTLPILTYHVPPLFTLACNYAQVELINAWIKTKCICVYKFNWYVNNQTNLFHIYRFNLKKQKKLVLKINVMNFRRRKTKYRKIVL